MLTTLIPFLFFKKLFTILYIACVMLQVAQIVLFHGL